MSEAFSFVLVCVISWTLRCFSGQTEQSTKSHKRNTKLVITEIVFKAKLPTKKERDSRLRSVTEFAEKVSTLIQTHI